MVIARRKETKGIGKMNIQTGQQGTSKVMTNLVFLGCDYGLRCCDRDCVACCLCR